MTLSRNTSLENFAKFDAQIDEKIHEQRASGDEYFWNDFNVKLSSSYISTPVILTTEQIKETD